MSLRLALLGSTTKPRNAGVSRILLVSFEVNRQPAVYGFHPRYRKLLALRRAVPSIPLPKPLIFFKFLFNISWMAPVRLDPLPCNLRVGAQNMGATQRGYR